MSSIVVTNSLRASAIGGLNFNTSGSRRDANTFIFNGDSNSGLMHVATSQEMTRKTQMPGRNPYDDNRLIKQRSNNRRSCSANENGGLTSTTEIAKDSSPKTNHQRLLSQNQVSTFMTQNRAAHPDISTTDGEQPNLLT